MHEIIRGSRRAHVPELFQVRVRRAHFRARRKEKGVVRGTGLLLETGLDRHALFLRASVFRRRCFCSNACCRASRRREGVHGEQLLVGPTRCGIVGWVVDVVASRHENTLTFAKTVVDQALYALKSSELVASWLVHSKFKHTGS